MPAKFKILAASRTDWAPIILGGMSIDCIERGGLGMVAERTSFYLKALGISVERLDKYIQGRPDNEVYALRSEIVRSTLDSDDSDEDDSGVQRTGTAMGPVDSSPVQRSPFGLETSLAEALRAEYDQVELDELVLDTIGVVIPTGGGAWLPVVRKVLRAQEARAPELGRTEAEILLAPESPELWERVPMAPETTPITEVVSSSEVVLPLEGGPEVAPGLWDTGRQEGMVFVGNPDGPDVELQYGDRIGAVVPAAVQTQACGKCGLVDTDALINDLTMCDVCGTLLPVGPTACRRCVSGPEEVEVRLYAGCSRCKGKIHSVFANTEPTDGEEGMEDGPKPGSSSLRAATVTAKKVQTQDPKVNQCFHIVEEPGGIRHMTDCEVPPAAYYVELQKDMIRRHPKACPHVLEHLLALEAFFDNSIVAGFSYGVAKAQILKTKAIY